MLSSPPSAGESASEPAPEPAVGSTAPEAAASEATVLVTPTGMASKPPDASSHEVSPDMYPGQQFPGNHSPTWLAAQKGFGMVQVFFDIAIGGAPGARFSGIPAVLLCD